MNSVLDSPSHIEYSDRLQRRERPGPVIPAAPTYQNVSGEMQESKNQLSRN